MNIDLALTAIEAAGGTSIELGERTPIWPDFPISEYQQRYARLGALMDLQGFDALVLTQEEPVRYLSGYNSVIWAVGRWLPTVLVATRDPKHAKLIVSSFDAGCAAGTAWVSDLDTYRTVEEIPAKVREHLSAAGAVPDRVGYEFGPGSFMAVPQHLAGLLTGSASAVPLAAVRTADGRQLGDQPRDAGRLISALRMIKSPLEVDRIRRSVSAAVAGYQAGLQAAAAGMTEKELVAIIASTMYRCGATAGTKPPFVNCVSGRKRYALVDTPASDNVIGDGDIVFVDGGGACDGYVSDILRLIGVGDLRPEDRRYAEVAADATQAMVGAVRPGVRVSELMAAAVRHVASAGLAEQVGEIAGHGIGLELWERPLIRAHDDPDDDVAVRPGMVLCLEPILAPPHPDGGLAGIFVFEQQVLVTEDGCEVLSSALPGRLWEASA